MQSLYSFLKKQNDKEFANMFQTIPRRRITDLPEYMKYYYVLIVLMKELFRIFDKLAKELPIEFEYQLLKKYPFKTSPNAYLEFHMNKSTYRVRVAQWQDLFSAVISFYIESSSYINRALIKLPQLKKKYYEEYRLIRPKFTPFDNPASLLVIIILKYLMQEYKYPEQCVLWQSESKYYLPINCRDIPLYRGIRDKKQLIKDNLNQIITSVRAFMIKDPPEDKDRFYQFILRKIEGIGGPNLFKEYITTEKLNEFVDKYKNKKITFIDSEWPETQLIDELYKRKLNVPDMLNKIQEGKKGSNIQISEFKGLEDIVNEIVFKDFFIEGAGKSLDIIARESSILELIEEKNFIVNRFSSTTLDKEYATQFAKIVDCCILEIRLKDFECLLIPSGKQLEVLLPPQGIFQVTEIKNDRIKVDYLGNEFPQVSLELFQSACLDLLMYPDLTGTQDPENILGKNIYQKFIKLIMK